MNREIKFRAWDGVEMWPYAMPTLDHTKINISKQEDGSWNRYVYFIKCILMQYTGLKDKNGVEIYEGDIIEINHPFRRRKYTGDVVFSDGQFNGKGFYFSHYDIPNNCFSEGIEYLTVIGNIYQNPELLNK